MAKSKILKELANDEIKINIALNRLMLLANDLNDTELLTWAEKELKGYDNDDELPEYRNIYTNHYIYTGFNGKSLNKNIPLQLIYLKGFDWKSFGKLKVHEPILSIIEKANSKEQMTIDCTDLAPLVYKNSFDGIIGIKCASISLVLNHSQYLDIVEKVKNKLLKIFMKLDKEYGNLDELDIDASTATEDHIEQTKKELYKIIYEEGSVNVTVNNNDFSKAKLKGSNVATDVKENEQTSKQTKTKVKDSNIGSGTQTVDKTTNISPNIAADGILGKVKK